MKKGDRKPRVPLVCEGCGKTFSLLQSQLGRGRGRTCSKTCADLVMQRGSELHCDLCDAAFYRAKSEQDADRHFCSTACHRGWRAFQRKGSTYPKDGARHRHRLVAERWLGRLLAPGEVVHHLDEDRQNASPENLAVFPNQSMHARCHQDRLTTEEIDRYRLTNLPNGAP